MFAAGFQALSSRGLREVGFRALEPQAVSDFSFEGRLHTLRLENSPEPGARSPEAVVLLLLLSGAFDESCLAGRRGCLVETLVTTVVGPHDALPSAESC